jgi:hypothetical protein
MKTSTYFLVIFLILFYGCKKDETARTWGTHTIDNLRYNENSTYAVHGFNFAKAAVVSTESQPGPDFTVDVNSNYLIFMSNNQNPSFYRFGEYTDESQTKIAFANLKDFTFEQALDIAGPVLPNQIWIFKTGRDTYAKIRIVSTKLEKRENLGRTIDFCECTFEWVYQPDGSLTFP